MRLDFKKGLSFVLALVMMVSTLTVVNVVSVSAAANTGYFSLDANDLSKLEGKTQEAGFTKVVGLANDNTVSAYKTEAGSNSFDDTVLVGTGKVFTKEAKLSGGDYEFTTAVAGTVNVYAYAASTGRTITITAKDNGSSTSNNDTSLGDRWKVVVKSLPITVSNPESPTTVTISVKSGVVILGIDFVTDGGSPAEPEKATISGKVTLSDTYEYIPPTGVTSDKDDTDEPYTCDKNVTFNGSEDTKKTVERDANSLSVTVKGPGEVNVNDVKTSGNTYTIGGTDGLTAGDYEITITADGQKTVETVNMPDTPAPQIHDVKIQTPSYEVKFVTNIKNFEDNVDSKNKPTLKVKLKDSDDYLFALNDVTYYNISDKDVNNGASTTHTIKMPAGDYEYVYDSTDYELSLSDDESSSSSLNFNVSRASTKNIYFIPKYDEAGAKTEVDAHKNEIINSVTRGTYTFKTDIIPSNENTPTSVGIEYNSTAYPDESDGTQHGMVAYFVKGLQNNKEDRPENQYLGLSKDHGAIIFKVGTPLLAKIETGYKACVLYEVGSKENAINGSHSAIPIDSSFGKRTVSLAPGTYAVISLADPAKSTEAQVKSIEFLVDSPFKVLTENLKDAGDYTIDGADNAKIIIGSYNASEDNLIGTTSAESYEKFAILIAGTQAALDVDAIDGIKEWEETENGYNAGKKNNSVSVTDNSGGYTTDNASVFTMTVFDSSTNKAATVIRDDTNYVFGSIKDDNGKDIITDTSGNTKYYATIVKNLAPGNYYAAGAAKVKGSTDDSKWLVQGDDIAQFTISE